MNMNYRDKAREIADDMPFLIYVMLPVIVLVVAISVIGYPLGWFSEAPTVAGQEFWTKKSLTKYQWFIDQQNAIQKMDQNILLYENSLKKVDDQYQTYGQDRAKWPPDVRTQYGHEIQQTLEDLVVVVSQRNNLVREYNAASDEFTWWPFQARKDMPRKNIEGHPIK